MKVLAIETSGLTGSIALLSDDGPFELRALNPRQRSAQSLAPAIKSLLHDAGWRPHDVQLVAVVVGPGSFTGLRVGITTAKVFAYSVGAAVSGVGTMEVLARQAPAAARPLDTVVDAHRGELFVTRWPAPGASGAGTVIPPIELVARDSWLGRLTSQDFVTGPGLAKLSELPTSAQVLDRSLWEPKADVLGQIALERARAGQLDSIWDLKPIYIRRSAAEEKASSQASTTPRD